MRESSPNNFPAPDPGSGSQSEGKFLFHNILAVSPCGSGFCSYPAHIPARQVLKNEYFRQKRGEILRYISDQDSNQFANQPSAQARGRVNLRTAQGTHARVDEEFALDAGTLHFVASEEQVRSSLT
jgi:hypothetical protein